MNLTWRDVLDGDKAISAGTHINDAVKIAQKVRYNYFTFNGRVFDLDCNELGKVEDLK